MSFGIDIMPTIPIITAAIAIGIRTWARVATKIQRILVIKNQLSRFYSRLDYKRRIRFQDNLKKKSEIRLESIKAAHKSSKSNLTRMEDYLEVISELVELKGYATTLDVSRYMNVSAPSVTKMLQRLDENGYLKYEKYHGINLTAKGNNVADAIRQKHGILLEFFEILGIEHDTANQDAEGIEHHLNPKTIKQLRKFIAYLKSNQKMLEGFKNL